MVAVVERGTRTASIKYTEYSILDDDHVCHTNGL